MKQASKNIDPADIVPLMMLGSRGGSGMSMFVYGVLFVAIGSLIGSGGVITFIMNYIGVTAPIVA
jgi:hypothetical protein